MLTSTLLKVRLHSVPNPREISLEFLEMLTKLSDYISQGSLGDVFNAYLRYNMWTRS